MRLLFSAEPNIYHYVYYSLEDPLKSYSLFEVERNNLTHRFESHKTKAPNSIEGIDQFQLVNGVLNIRKHLVLNDYHVFTLDNLALSQFEKYKGCILKNFSTGEDLINQEAQKSVSNLCETLLRDKQFYDQLEMTLKESDTLTRILRDKEGSHEFLRHCFAAAESFGVDIPYEKRERKIAKCVFNKVLSKMTGDGIEGEQILKLFSQSCEQDCYQQLFSGLNNLAMIQNYLHLLKVGQIKGRHPASTFEDMDSCINDFTACLEDRINTLLSEGFLKGFYLEELKELKYFDGLVNDLEAELYEKIESGYDQFISCLTEHNNHPDSLHNCLVEIYQKFSILVLERSREDLLKSFTGSPSPSWDNFPSFYNIFRGVTEGSNKQFYDEIGDVGYLVAAEDLFFQHLIDSKSVLMGFIIAEKFFDLFSVERHLNWTDEKIDQAVEKLFIFLNEWMQSELEVPIFSDEDVSPLTIIIPIIERFREFLLKQDYSIDLSYTLALNLRPAIVEYHLFEIQLISDLFGQEAQMEVFNNCFLSIQSNGYWMDNRVSSSLDYFQKINECATYFYEQLKTNMASQEQLRSFKQYVTNFLGTYRFHPDFDDDPLIGRSERKFNFCLDKTSRLSSGDFYDKCEILLQLHLSLNRLMVILNNYDHVFDELDFGVVLRNYLINLYSLFPSLLEITPLKNLFYDEAPVRPFVFLDFSLYQWVNNLDDENYLRVLNSLNPDKDKLILMEAETRSLILRKVKSVIVQSALIQARNENAVRLSMDMAAFFEDNISYEFVADFLELINILYHQSSGNIRFNPFFEDGESLAGPLFSRDFFNRITELIVRYSYLGNEFAPHSFSAQFKSIQGELKSAIKMWRGYERGVSREEFRIYFRETSLMKTFALAEISLIVRNRLITYARELRRENLGMLAEQFRASSTYGPNIFHHNQVILMNTRYDELERFIIERMNYMDLRRVFTEHNNLENLYFVIDRYLLPKLFGEELKLTQADWMELNRKVAEAVVNDTKPGGLVEFFTGHFAENYLAFQHRQTLNWQRIRLESPQANEIVNFYGQRILIRKAMGIEIHPRLKKDWMDELFEKLLSAQRQLPRRPRSNRR